MSEFIAEAQVLVRPNTELFRTALQAQLTAATARPVTVPVVPVIAGGAAAGVGVETQALAGLTAAMSSTRNATQALNITLAEQTAILKILALATEQEVGAQATLDNVQRKTLGSSERMKAALLGLRSAIGGAAVIGLGALSLAAIVTGKAFRAAIDETRLFEETLSTFGAVTGATAEELNAVSDASLRLGRDIRLPGVSASDAATAILELAKAGLDAQEAIEGAEGVLQLATAAQISNADAALITANALNAFGLAGSKAVLVADSLANAANAAQGSINDFGLALRQVAAVGNQVGLGLQNTTALLTILARGGLQGSDAGTSLRVSLLRLINPTKEANAILDSLNITLRDLQGNIRPEVFADFAEATRGLGPNLRDAAAAAVFGADGIRAVAIAGEEGAAGLKLAQFQIDQQGTAAVVAAAKNEGLSGSMRNLENQASAAGLSLGQILSPALQEVADVAALSIAGVGTFIDKIIDLGNAIDDLPGEGWGRRLFGEFSLIPVQIISKSDEEIKKLTEDMLDLQKARALAQEGGSPAAAAAFTPQINDLRRQIRALKIEAGILVPPQSEAEKHLRQLSNALKIAQERAEELRGAGVVDLQLDKSIDILTVKVIKAAQNLGKDVEKEVVRTFESVSGNIQKALTIFEIDPTGDQANEAVARVKKLVGRLEALAPEAGKAGRKIAQSLAKALQDAITAAAEAGNLPAAKALKRFVDQLALDTQANINNAFGKIKIPLLGDEIAEALQPSGVEVAREGARGTRRSQIGALQDRLDEVRALIATGRAEGAELEQLFNEERSINDEIQGLYDSIASEAEDAQKDRFERFQDRLAAALRPTQRLLIRAAGTELLGDDIKFREQLISIYRSQIELVKKVLGNTKQARELIAGIQDAILSEINKLKDDQQNFRKQLRDALEERLERIRTGVELDIELADINENTRKRIRLREELIRQLLRERKKLHLTGNALKENRNEIARINAEIADIKKETEKTGKGFSELAFEFLQTQQGFAANLLGNLIPTGSTAGLVSEAKAPTVTTQIQAQAAARPGLPTRGQAATEVDILKQVLQVLREIRNGRAHPEAQYQRQTANSTMDFVGGV